MTKILMVSTQKPDGTGSGVFLRELAASFAREGHEVQVVAGIAAGDDFGFPPGVRFSPVRFETDELPFPVVGMSDAMPYRATRYRDLSPDMLKRLLGAFDRVIDGVLARFRPDVVFSNHLYVLTAHLAARGLGIPMVGMCHGTEIRQMRKIALERDAVRAGVRRLSAIMALHAGQKDEIVAEYGVPASMVAVTGTGFNSGIFNMGAGPGAAADARPGGLDAGSGGAVPAMWESRGRTLVFAGKVTAAKGVPSLLRAMDRLPCPGDAKLTIAGGYATEAEYASIVSQARRVSCQVDFAGRLPQEALARAYRASDVFVLPSFFEGLPLVAIEALACGCKAVMTDLPGIRPWLQANAPDAPVWYVEPPAMGNVDEPVPEALPAFEARLAEAMEQALAAPAAIGDVSGLSWDSLARRALALA